MVNLAVHSESRCRRPPSNQKAHFKLIDFPGVSLISRPDLAATFPLPKLTEKLRKCFVQGTAPQLPEDSQEAMVCNKARLQSLP